MAKVATTTRTENGATIIKYHKTDVVSFGKKTITLDSGGWKTSTTKRRMNEASKDFDLGIHVFQRAKQWYVDNGNEVVDFSDGMTINR